MLITAWIHEDGFIPSHILIQIHQLIDEFMP